VRSQTLLLALYMPDDGFDPNLDFDPDDSADGLVAIINEERRRNAIEAGRPDWYRPVTVSAIPAPQWVTADSLAKLRAAPALEAERDLYRSLAERAADMWQPTFGLDPGEGVWVFPWSEDVADEAMTPEQVEFHRKRREARR
jgi:hypothetical protein